MGFFSSKDRDADQDRTNNLVDDVYDNVRGNDAGTRNFARVLNSGLVSSDGQRGEYPPAGHSYPRR